MFLMSAAIADARDNRSKGQRVHVPVYSAIGYRRTEKFDLIVILAFRNLDEKTPITIRSAVFFDAGGKKIKDLLEGPLTLAPFGMTETFVREQDFRGSFGGHVVVE